MQFSGRSEENQSINFNQGSKTEFSVQQVVEKLEHSS